ncbi:MAG: hypothetical protein RLZZ258_385 [Actinomycetota bacterium]|jgi:hypothetical protein
MTVIQKQDHKATGTLLLIFYVLTLASYPEFFFYNPFENPMPAIGALQMVSLIGWICTGIVAPTMLIAGAKVADSKRGFLVFALAWPASLLVLHATLLAVTGNPFLTYLVQEPFFLFTDIIAPAIMFSIWRAARKATSSTQG